MAKWIVGVLALVLAGLSLPAQAGRWSIGYSDYGWNGGYSISVGGHGRGYGSGWYAPYWYAPAYSHWDRYGYGYPRVVYRTSGRGYYGYRAPYRYDRYSYAPRYRDWRHDRYDRYWDRRRDRHDRYWNDRRDRYSRQNVRNDRYYRDHRYDRNERAYDRSRRDAYYNAQDDAWRGARNRDYGY